jgi:nicotinate-nucleotide adenylyltransferase
LWLPQGQIRQALCCSAVWRLRLGLFGGTFDPPHVGHLVTAVNVRHELGLERVLLEVANRPWQKEGLRAISSAEDRFALVAAAVAGVEGLEASRIEIDRGGVSYTADTLAELEQRHPGAELFTIVGSDAAAGLLTWERYDEVARRSRLVVVERPGNDAELPREVSWLRVVVPHLDVSSTDLRARVVDGRPLDYLVPEDVLAEIRRRRMYEPAGAHVQGRR